MTWSVARKEMLQACITGSRSRATGGAPLRFGLIKHLWDGRAGENVMELMKEQNRPGPVLPLLA